MASVLFGTSPLSGEEDRGATEVGSGTSAAKALVNFAAALRLSAASSGWPPLAWLACESLLVLGLSLSAMLRCPIWMRPQHWELPPCDGPVTTEQVWRICGSTPFCPCLRVAGVLTLPRAQACTSMARSAWSFSCCHRSHSSQAVSTTNSCILTQEQATSFTAMQQSSRVYSLHWMHMALHSHFVFALGKGYGNSHPNEKGGEVLGKLKKGFWK